MVDRVHANGMSALLRGDDSSDEEIVITDLPENDIYNISIDSPAHKLGPSYKSPSLHPSSFLSSSPLPAPWSAGSQKDGKDGTDGKGSSSRLRAGAEAGGGRKATASRKTKVDNDGTQQRITAFTTLRESAPDILGVESTEDEAGRSPDVKMVRTAQTARTPRAQSPPASPTQSSLSATQVSQTTLKTYGKLSNSHWKKPLASPPRERAAFGLQNIGNTCYMNAVLTSLLHNPVFTRIILDESITLLKIYHEQRAKKAPIEDIAWPTQSYRLRHPKPGLPASCFPPDTEFLCSARQALNNKSTIPIDFQQSRQMVLANMKTLLQHENRAISAPLAAFGQQSDLYSEENSPGEARKGPPKLPLITSVKRAAIRRAAGQRIDPDLLNEIKERISSKHQTYVGSQQHDAHEFLIDVLDTLNTELIPFRTDLVAINGLCIVDGLNAATMPPALMDLENYVAHHEGRKADFVLPSFGTDGAWMADGDSSSPLARAARVAKQAEFTAGRTLFAPRFSSFKVKTRLACTKCQHPRDVYDDRPCWTVRFPESGGPETGAGAVDTAPGEKRKRSAMDRDSMTHSDGDSDDVVCAKRARRVDGSVDRPPTFDLLALVKSSLENDEWEFRCSNEACSGTRVTVHSEIVTLPRVLVLHIDRTSWKTGVPRKLDHAVEFPVELDLSEFLAEVVQLPPPTDLRWPDNIAAEIDSAILKTMKAEADSGRPSRADTIFSNPSVDVTHNDDTNDDVVLIDEAPMPVKLPPAPSSLSSLSATWLPDAAPIQMPGVTAVPPGLMYHQKNTVSVPADIASGERKWGSESSVWAKHPLLCEPVGSRQNDLDSFAYKSIGQKVYTAATARLRGSGPKPAAKLPADNDTDNSSSSDESSTSTPPRRGAKPRQPALSIVHVDKEIQPRAKRTPRRAASRTRIDPDEDLQRAIELSLLPQPEAEKARAATIDEGQPTGEQSSSPTHQSETASATFSNAPLEHLLEEDATPALQPPGVQSDDSLSASDHAKPTSPQAGDTNYFERFLSSMDPRYAGQLGLVVPSGMGPPEMVAGARPVRPVYHLQSVIRHEGTRASEGHYTSDVRGEASCYPLEYMHSESFSIQDASKAKWQRYDDAHVSEKTLDDVTGRIAQRKAYMMFYVLEEPVDL